MDAVPSEALSAASVPSSEEAPAESEDAAILSGWTENDWARLLVHAELQRFPSGQVVIRAGEVDRTLFVVADGRLETRFPGVERRALVGRGSVLGEVAFFDGYPRSASVFADGDVELLRLTPSAFDEFARREPALARTFVFELGRILSLRLREERRALSSAVGSARGVFVHVSPTAALPSRRIEVDEALRESQVAEIADTDFFRQLQTRAQTFRRRNTG
jgi:CRP-like cAMP-binding protein